MTPASASTPSSKRRRASPSPSPTATSRRPQSAKIAPFSTNDGGEVGYSSGNGRPSSSAEAPPPALEWGRPAPASRLLEESRQPCGPPRLGREVDWIAASPRGVHVPAPYQPERAREEPLRRAAVAAGPCRARPIGRVCAQGVDQA